jgi:WD40 repeat protein
MAVGILRDGSPVIASGGDDTVRVWRLADCCPTLRMPMKASLAVPM